MNNVKTLSGDSEFKSVCAIFSITEGTQQETNRLFSFVHNFKNRNFYRLNSVFVNGFLEKYIANNVSIEQP